MVSLANASHLGANKEANLHAAFYIARYIIAIWLEKIFFSLKKNPQPWKHTLQEHKGGVLMWPFEEHTSYRSIEQMENPHTVNILSLV